MSSLVDKNTPAPILKWVGGKRQLVSQIIKDIPDLENMCYYEPFIGGGAMLFALCPGQAVINDYNSELVNVYRVVKDFPNELIADLIRHQNTADYFYEIRNLDRNPKVYTRLSCVQKASRIIFLNKTCFNGLYRVNRKGEFNSPFGRYKNPNIVNESGIMAVSDYLNTHNIQILNGDYEVALRNADSNSFVYLDPPYHPISPTCSFTSYIAGGWSEEDQIRLRNVCRRLTQNRVRFVLSNSDCEFIREIYSEFNIRIVKAKRAINSNGAGRGCVNEVLVKNF